METLLALDHRRFLTARQLSRLYCRGEAEAIADPVARLRAIAAADRQVNRRTLRPLKDAELITVVRPFLRGETTPLAQKEAVVLTARGAELVRQAYAEAERGQGLRWRRSWLAIDGANHAHAALLTDWYILARRAMTEGLLLQGWRDDRDLAQLVQQGGCQLRDLIPDAVFVLTHRDASGSSRHTPFVLELDLGAETVTSGRFPTRDWTAKIERYLTYFAGPLSADPLWTGIVEPPRVLTLTTSEARLASLIQATAHAGGDDRFWFATLDRLRGDREPISVFWDAPWRTAGTARARSLGALLNR
jgi:hypothetical protein